MEREAEGRGMEGTRDNNQMDDRIQVFGFARQPLGCLHSLWQLMVSDDSGVIGRQSRDARQKSFGPGGER